MTKKKNDNYIKELVCILLILFLFATSIKAQNSISGCYLSFSCCFHEDSVKVLLSHKTIFEDILNTSSTSGICEGKSFFIKQSKHSNTLRFFFSNNTQIDLRVCLTSKMKFVLFYNSGEGQVHSQQFDVMPSFE